MEFCSLNKVLDVLGTPLTEEQAWAVCYQCAKCAEHKWAEKEKLHKSRCITFNGIESVDICNDGSIRINDSIVPPVLVRRQSELVESIGLVIYQALDYGLDEAEEHCLSSALEGLIEYMTENDNLQENDNGDEEIQNDVKDESNIAESETVCLHVGHILQVCSAHFPSHVHAHSHYKAVCRAIYAEVTELSTFLEKVSAENEKLKLDRNNTLDGTDGRLEDLKRADWARLWIQMMHELRQGVKLRKRQSQQDHQFTEYALTPYEILMGDIRSKRYTLNKVKVNGDIPSNIKEDAHNMMLQFIRSRPPLHPVSSRKINTLSDQLPDPREKLLSDIRSEHQLRPTPGRSNEAVSPISDKQSDVSMSSRKIIKPNLKLHLSDEEEEFCGDSEDKNKVSPSSLSPLSPLSPLKMKGTSSSSSKPDHNIDIGHDETAHENRNSEKNRPLCQKLQSGSMIRCQSPSDCLSLTLEEVMHIRNVLTKAELESLLVNPALHAQVETAKVCFACKVTKFSLFGNWSIRCKFCQRYVCSACITKMQIPGEYIESIPVYAISPSPLSPVSDVFLFDVSRSGEQLCPSKWPSQMQSSHGSCDHKTTQDDGQRSVASNNKYLAGPLLKLKDLAKQGASIALSHNEFEESPSDALSKSINQSVHFSARLHGPTVNICHDCKAMIEGIINASHQCLCSTHHDHNVD